MRQKVQFLRRKLPELPESRKPLSINTNKTSRRKPNPVLARCLADLLLKKLNEVTCGAKARQLGDLRDRVRCLPQQAFRALKPCELNCFEDGSPGDFAKSLLQTPPRQTDFRSDAVDRNIAAVLPPNETQGVCNLIVIHSDYIRRTASDNAERFDHNLPPLS